MGKYLVQYAIPAIILSVAAYRLVKWWYLKVFPKHVKEHNKINKATQKYERDLK